ncbi:DNA-protecting protein DprA (plasmid) [Streptomyces sp. NBC_01186]|uniref:DNA-processing protein DprA n=1 Tax=Streptomyces sp. NBC_01186 TaxID=2903765 RepID=UPI002E13FA4E|nr:DNA-protecting protein DprA [Streptomyces sp. NBC_01186]
MFTTDDISERAARAALAVFYRPDQVAAALDEHDAVSVWRQRVERDSSGRLAAYRPMLRMEQAQPSGEYVIPGDASWPVALDAMGAERPLGIWTTGTARLSDLSQRAVAVTGNRAASKAGRTQAATIAGDLAEAGYAVCSTLAYGVDTKAQHGAHAQGGATIAVLPCGLDLCHPYNHTPLKNRTAQDGALVSLCPPGTKTSRNTLHAAADLTALLSRAVVIIEGTQGTTAMRCAALAQRLSRPVGTLSPDLVGYECSSGNRALLAAGARELVRGTDVL